MNTKKYSCIKDKSTKKFYEIIIWKKTFCYVTNKQTKGN